MLTTPVFGDVVIDPFSDTQTNQTADGTQSDGTILGGQRDVDYVDSVAGTWTVDGSGEASFTATGGPGELRLTYDGVDGSVTANALGLGNVDLTEGGANDRFLLTVSSLGGSTSFTVLIRAFTDATGNFTNWPFEVNAPGTYNILFSDGVATTPADLTNVDSIFLFLGTDATLLSDDRIDDTESFSISDFRAAPETVPNVSPVLTLTGKKTIRTSKRKVTVKGTATDDSSVSSVLVTYRKVKANGKKKKVTKPARLVGSVWKFQIRPTEKRTKLKIQAFDDQGAGSSIQKVKIIRKP